MSISWPEKKESTYQKDWDQEKAVFNKGYNAAREDCIKAWEESPKLVELEPELWGVWNNSCNKIETKAQGDLGIFRKESEAKRRCAWLNLHFEKFGKGWKVIKFGTKPRPVVTVEEWEDVIDSHIDQPPSNVFYQQQKRAIAKAIVKKLEEGK